MRKFTTSDVKRHSKNLALKEAEQRIIQQYNQIALGHSNSNHLEITATIHQKIPKQMPIKQNGKCFSLYQCTFHDMLTLTIFQYLFTNISKAKKAILTDLKRLIYSDSFMQQDFYTKGLIAKGFQLINAELQFDIENGKLVAQCLFREDFGRAFAQCWKQLINRACSEYSIGKIKEDNLVEILDVLGSYFSIDFSVYIKQNQNIFEIEGNQNHSQIYLVINEGYKGQDSWQYLILITKNNQKISHSQHSSSKSKSCYNQQLCQSSDISKIDEIQNSSSETQDLKNLFQNKNICNKLEKTAARKCSCSKYSQIQSIQSAFNTIHETIGKGNNLIQDCQLYLRQLQSLPL